MTPALVDTNILVYAYDTADPVKHQRAVRLIDALSREGALVLTSQILNEFTWVLLRKKIAGGPSLDALPEILAEIAESAQVLPLTVDLTFAALAKVPLGLAFWDALIWAAAARYGIPVVYSEDFQHDRQIEGVRFLNPFL